MPSSALGALCTVLVPKQIKLGCTGHSDSTILDDLPRMAITPFIAFPTAMHLHVVGSYSYAILLIKQEFYTTAHMHRSRETRHHASDTADTCDDEHA